MSQQQSEAITGRRVHLVSLGCPKNWVDSEVMLGYLHRGGYEPVPEPQDADLIVVNTCAFIQKATEEAVETILQMARWKEAGLCRNLVVTGCLPQRYGEELQALLPEVDLFLGTAEVARIADRLRTLRRNESRFFHRQGRSYLYSEADPRVRAGAGSTAYVKIAEGCSNRCSYCAVPMIRGPLQSRSIASVVREVQQLAREGVLEVILVAQDTTAFGRDRGAAGELAKLLGILDGMEGVEWIRLMYAHPAHMTDELMEALAFGKRIVPYLDLPIQHISPRILKGMKRGTGPEEIERLIQEIRQAVPGIHLRTSVIVGFPGETEEEFQALLRFVGEAQFEWLGAFPYSPEPGTPAARMKPAVREEVVRDRLDRLMRLQQRITGRCLRRWLGRTIPVLVEGARPGVPGEAVGRAPFQAPEVDGVVYLTGKAIDPGKIQPVRITSALDYDLVGVAEGVGEA